MDTNTNTKHRAKKEPKQIIYLLTLEEGKYYVGRTTNPDRRYLDHLAANGEGSQWTKIYKPKSISILCRNASAFDEDKYVKISMAKHGIDNVRGGTYSTIALHRETINQLYREIINATDRCFTCGQAGHFASSCTQKRVNPETTPALTAKPLTVRKCSICKKPGHNKRKCPKQT